MVLQWRVVRQLKRNCKSVASKSMYWSSSNSLFKGVLKVWSVCSAAPSEDGWCGEIVRCLIPFNLPTLLNSWLKKEGPIFLTRKYAMSWIANISLVRPITAVDYIVLIGITFQKTDQQNQCEFLPMVMWMNWSFVGHCVMNLVCITCFH